MTTNNEAFEKWAKDYGFDITPNKKTSNTYAEYETHCANLGWQAATTEASKRMAELESEVAELKAELDKFGVKKQLYKDKWVVYKPEDAPYAGIRTEDGVTIAGTSSGLSEQDAHEICANRVDADSLFAMVGMLANERTKITELQADNNRLREALDMLVITKEYKEKQGKDAVYETMRTNAWNVAEQALSATPAESLQALKEVK